MRPGPPTKRIGVMIDLRDSGKTIRSHGNAQRFSLPYVRPVPIALSGKCGAGRGRSWPLIYRDTILLSCHLGARDHALIELETFYEDSKDRPECMHNL